MSRIRNVVCRNSALATAIAVLAAGVVLGSAAGVGAVSRAVDSVVITEPSNGEDFEVYTTGAVVPDSIIIEVEAAVVGNASLVEFGLDGELNGDTWTGPSITDAFGQDSNEYFGAVDLTDGDGFAVRGGGVAATLRAFATADQYYARATTAFDAVSNPITVTVEVLDADTIDASGNGVPDADALSILAPADGDEVTIIRTPDPDNPQIVKTTSVKSIDQVSGSRGVVLGTDVVVGAEINGVAYTVTVRSPTLAELQAAFPGDGTLAAALNGVIIVAVSDAPYILVDDQPVGSNNPLTEFDEGLGASPSGAFVGITIILETSAAVWEEFTTTFDADTMIEVEVSSSALDGLTEVAVYEYATDFSQSGNDLDVLSGGSGWVASAATPALADATYTVLLDSSGVIVGAAAVVPRSGGGSSSTCFIATAAYGTPLSQDIDSLRSVRDAYLLNNAFGGLFVDTYYRLSPPIADRVAANPAFALVVRSVLLPVVLLSKMILAAPAFVLLLLAGMAGALARIGYLRKRSV